MVDITSGWELLKQGQIFNSVIEPFSQTMGLPIFYTSLQIVALTLIYIKTENLTVVSIAMMMSSAIILPLVTVPSVQLWFWILFLLGLAVSIYSVFKSVQ